jgi:type IV pilus assembly protein PilM
MLKSLQQKVEKFFAPQLPGVGCEIAEQYISLARINPRNRFELERFSVTPLPENLVTPSLTAPLISSPEGFLECLRAAFTQADLKTNRISLAIPDQVARISLHIMDHFGGSNGEKNRLLKWKLKKTVPFNVEECRLSFIENRRPDGKVLVLTVSIFTPIVEQLEVFFDQLGVRVGWITPSSLAGLELFTRAEASLDEETVLLVTMRPAGVTILLVEKGVVVLFRQNQVPGMANNLTSDLLSPEQLYYELHPCLMYYLDKFGSATISRICLASSTVLSPHFCDSLAGKIGFPVTLLDPVKLLSPRGTGGFHSQKNALIPALGLALGKF